MLSSTPDGVPSESLAIFKFGLSCARTIQILDLSSAFISLLIKCLLPWILLLYHYHPIFQYHRNQSTVTLLTVFGLFIESGAAIRAAMSGLRPIYFNDTSLGLSIDAYICHMATRNFCC